jgi:hypothetical protein
MSETTTDADGVTTTSQPPSSEAPPESTPAPATTAAEATEQTEEEGQRPDRDTEGRRVAQVRARLAAAERERDALRAEAEFYRQRAQPVAPEDETPEQRYQRERGAMRQEVEAQIRTETFHQQGATQYGDWKQRCDDLVAMGADAGFAQLLVEMPGGEGVRVAAALAADPDAVERIANLRSERARAVALGKYAATIEDTTHDRPRPNGVNGAAAAPAVTRAPAPVRPVTGRASPQFNEYTATAQQLADFYMRQTLEKQTRR